MAASATSSTASTTARQATCRGPCANIHPDASVPSPDLAYHDGGFYEVVLAIAILAIIWRFRGRQLPPLAMLWSVVGLYAVGRFVMFFARSDSAELALGLTGAQWTSAALALTALLGLFHAVRYRSVADALQETASQ